eukprot:m.16234 g.16234  ORF g.16234 m.16234 type:complete len:492 (-) comp10944_c0_seq1:245-1720(-)
MGKKKINLKSSSASNSDAPQARCSDFTLGLLAGVGVCVAAMLCMNLFSSQADSGQGETIYKNNHRRQEKSTTSKLTVDILSTVDTIKRDNPRAAIDFIETKLLNADEFGIRDQIKLYTKTGDLYSFLKWPKQAYAPHVKAHKLLLGYTREHENDKAAFNDLAVSYIAVATDLYQTHQFEKALKLVDKVVNSLNLPQAAMQVMMKLQSTIFECKGDFLTALQLFEQAMKATTSATLDDVMRNHDLIKRVRETEELPAEINKMMQQKQTTLLHHLFDQGEWQSQWQLPKHFIPGLVSKPWHDVSDAGVIQTAVALLESQHPRLLSEFNDLKRMSLLSTDQECIHEVGQGEWSKFEITGIWQILDDDKCSSKETPVACEVFANLKELGLSVVRAGYSAVEAGAWLRPHFGMTNAQLKFHLGLDIPGGASGSTQCAFFRVKNETRGWESGKVLFFDDSFEHEVHNKCNRERVVFQVVFVHPGLKDKSLFPLGPPQ